MAEKTTANQSPPPSYQPSAEVPSEAYPPGQGHYPPGQGPYPQQAPSGWCNK